MQTVRYRCNAQQDSRGRWKPCFMLQLDWSAMPEGTSVDVIDTDSSTYFVSDVLATPESHVLIQGVPSVEIV